MRRKIAEKLVEWRNRDGRHPLILRGARQVGKTFLVRELAKGFANYLEVKGGTTGSMKGLHLYLNEKHVDFAVRFNADRPSYLKNAHARDVLGRDCDFRFLSLPLYMVCEGVRLAECVLKDASLGSFVPCAGLSADSPSRA